MFGSLATPRCGAGRGRRPTPRYQPGRFDPSVLARLLQIACYFLIAYLSGIRDSEVRHLRTGSTRALLDGAGRRYRWTITSLAFKGEHDPAGTPATWIIGVPAARAVTVLERLQPPGAELRFEVLHHRLRARPGAPATS
ncbi:hypothetical protein ACFTXB_07255 [Streptomyces sp. NPDC057074]|uniref:hypothetical protein n=1 Tax=Streptomyces sp. NPDC057074 TaxID=3346015 RepID=UPI00362AE39F